MIHSSYLSLLHKSVFINEANPRPLGSSGTLFTLLFAKMSFNTENACVHQMLPDFCHVNVVLPFGAHFTTDRDKVTLACAQGEGSLGVENVGSSFTQKLLPKLVLEKRPELQGCGVSQPLEASCAGSGFEK